MLDLVCKKAFGIARPQVKVHIALHPLVIEGEGNQKGERENAGEEGGRDRGITGLRHLKFVKSNPF